MKLKRKLPSIVILGLTITTMSLGYTSCSSQKTKSQQTIHNDLVVSRYANLLTYAVDSVSFPRSMTPASGKINKVPSKDWTSGFFAGNLWQIYELTGDERYKEKAKEWTAFIEKEKYNNRTHDMGFKVFCSFGAGYAHTKDAHYKKVIVESAETLSTRYNENVKSLRSWDFNRDIWEFPVIIDNMMNLELLFEASILSGNQKYRDIAINHANTTLKNHFRANNSTYHVVVYDTLTGGVKDKVTHQGINDDSSWARGQGWAIYGYTMLYRYTKDQRYLEQAKKTAGFYLNHPRLRNDGVPYWDFDDPAIPNAPRDVSAATLIASSFVELYEYTNDRSYLNYATALIETLHSEEYTLSKNIPGPFLLDHSTGNHPKNDEIDEPIVYADYYYLETLLRLKNLKKN